jgi:hypothetical protein
MIESWEILIRLLLLLLSPEIQKVRQDILKFFPNYEDL